MYSTESNGSASFKAQISLPDRPALRKPLPLGWPGCADSSAILSASAPSAIPP